MFFGPYGSEFLNVLCHTGTPESVCESTVLFHDTVPV